MSRSSDTKTAWAVALFLAIATLVTFSPVRRNGFVGFDDPRYITQNERVKAGLTAPGVRWALTTTHAYNWHPLTWVSHMADVELFGLDAGRHHLTSVTLHAANAVLLFLLLRAMTGALWPSALVAFIFALHPLRVESVAWASERKDVLGTMFWLLTTAAYVRYVRRPGPRRYALVVAAFAAGLAAKPMLVTLPLILLLLDYWPLARWPAERAPLRRLILEKLPLLAMSLAAGMVTLAAQRGIVQSTELFPIEHRIANAVLSCARYLGKMAWPTELAVFYPHPGITFRSPAFWGALAVLGAASALARWRVGFLAVGWLWYLVALVPVLGLVQAGVQSMADRYTYVPGIGVAIAVAFGAAEAVGGRRRWRVALAAAAAIVVAVLAALSWRQTRVWRDDESLFRHAASVTPDSYWARYNLGLALLRAGRAGEAVAHFQEATRLEPTSREAHANLGAALERTNQLDGALAAYREAAAIDPESLFAARDLARVLVLGGRASEAAPILEAAVVRWPRDVELHYSLGLARLGTDRAAAAVEPLARAIELDPAHAAAENALGIALARSGEAQRAMAHFERAVELEPGYDEARANLSRVRAALGEQ